MQLLGFGETQPGDLEPSTIAAVHVRREHGLTRARRHEMAPLLGNLRIAAQIPYRGGVLPLCYQ